LVAFIFFAIGLPSSLVSTETPLILIGIL
jgi:hypothetical protein